MSTTGDWCFKDPSLEDNLKKALTEMILLHLLSREEQYIGALSEIIQKKSGGSLTLVFPYAAIYRMQQAELIEESGKRIAPDGRRRQYFRITDVGRKQLDRLLHTYRLFIRGLEMIIDEGADAT